MHGCENLYWDGKKVDCRFSPREETRVLMETSGCLLAILKTTFQHTREGRHNSQRLGKETIKKCLSKSEVLSHRLGETV